MRPSPAQPSGSLRNASGTMSSEERMPNMAVHVGQSVMNAVRLGWLTGPIFDKELRVSSRRRRNYVLRFLYILLLTVFIGVAWLAVVPIGGDAGFAPTRMG